MRVFFLLLLVGLTACDQTAVSSGQTKKAAKTEPSADALAAKATVDTYLEHIEQRDFVAASRMWDQTTVSAPALERAYAKYSSVRASTGTVTEVSIVNALQYVTVTALVEGVMRADGQPIRESGTIMLRRPMQTKGDWRIWATDIRAR